MSLPFFNLNLTNDSIKDELRLAVEEVLGKGKFILDAKVQILEEKIAQSCGVNFGIGVASGSDALYLSLRGLGIGQGDEVITTPYTFFATAGAISLTGAVPVFVDINADTFNIDPEKIREFLEQQCDNLSDSKYPINLTTKAKVKAIVPVHLFGQCAEMEPIGEIAANYNLLVIEDAAQGFGCAQLFKGKFRYAGGFGVAGTFSFYPTKNLGGLGDGGMIVTSDEKFAAKLRKLRNHGQQAENYHSEIGINSRLDEIQAAVLLTKMKYLKKWNQERQKIWRIYSEELARLVMIPKIKENNQSVFHQFVIRTRQRDALREYLAKNGIETKIYYPLPHHLQECYKGLGYKEGDLPIAESCAKQALALPIYPGLTSEKVEFICENIKDFFTDE